MPLALVFILTIAAYQLPTASGTSFHIATGVVQRTDYRTWRSPVSDLLNRVKQLVAFAPTSKSGLSGFPSRMPSAIRTKSEADPIIETTIGHF